MDEGDNDISTFFHYIGVAAKRLNLGKKKPLPHLTPEYRLGIGTFTRRYFEDLFGRMARTFILVLDNFQEASSDKFYEVVRDSLYEIPESCNIVIISRTDPPQTFARSLANQEIKIIGWEDMRLRNDETKGIARFLGQKNPIGNFITQLQDKAEGWAAGLLLILERGRAGGYTRQEIRRVAVESVFNYFMDEIFKKTDYKTREFLLKTSLFPNMTVGMAESLTINKKSGQILKNLSFMHFFTERRLSAKDIYQYHPLFREFLLSIVRESFTAKELSKLKIRAANLLSENGQVEDAARLYSETEDWEHLSRLIFKTAMPLINQGRLQILESWINSIPGTIIKDTPWLLYYLGLCRFPFNPSDSLSIFESAFHIFRERGDKTGFFMSWSGAVDSIFFRLGDYILCDRWIEMLEDIMQEGHEFPSPEVEAHVSSRMFISLMLRQPHYLEFNKWMERVILLLQESRDLSFQIFAGNYLTVHYLWTGDFAKAEAVIDLLRKSVKTQQTPPAWIIFTKLTKAAYHCLTASHNKCLDKVSEGLKMALDTGVYLWNHHFLCFGAHSAMIMGEAAIYNEYIQKMPLALIEGKDFDASFHHHTMGLHSLLTGNISRALIHNETSLKLSIKVGNPFIEASGHFGMSQVLHDMGRHRKAKEHLTMCRQIGRKIKNPVIEYMCLLTDAQFAFDKGHEKTALKPLDMAMKLGHGRGYFNFFGFRPPVMAKLCAKALEAGIEAGYVQEIIRRNNLTPPFSPSLIKSGTGGVGEVENWPWQIKIFTLGRFEIFKDDKKIEFLRKAQKKPLALLKAIISHGGRDVSEEEIADALWPDSEGDMARQSFDTTLHRLRKLIGSEKVIQHRERKLTLDARYCYADAWGFENIIAQFDAVGNKEKTFSAIEKAVNLYKGHFLAGDMENSWAIPYREHLRDKFIGVVERLAGYYEANGEFKKAIDLYYKGIRIDRVVEKFYKNLMLLYKLIGNRNEALRVYKECVITLSHTLGVEPSYETRAIHKSLLT